MKSFKICSIIPANFVCGCNVVLFYRGEILYVTKDIRKNKSKCWKRTLCIALIAAILIIAVVIGSLSAGNLCAASFVRALFVENPLVLRGPEISEINFLCSWHNIQPSNCRTA